MRTKKTFSFFYFQVFFLFFTFFLNPFFLFASNFAFADGTLAVELPATAPPAQQSPTNRVYTILPNAQIANTTTPSACREYLKDKPSDELRKILKSGEGDYNKVLFCAIQTGGVRFFMIPYFIRNILEFIIQIAGIICVGAIILGGFYYLFSGISDNVEKGKSAILYGIVGMVLTFLAWAIVNVVIRFFVGL